MDEPTTGMDPVNKRHVWNIIQKLKQDRSIIMSTHAMDEAEILSDRILILDHGISKCIGTTL
jgi:ABC-type multidrug transport system ATPase subunit